MVSKTATPFQGDKQSDPLQNPVGYTQMPKEMMKSDAVTTPDSDHRSWFTRWKEQREFAKANQNANEVIIETSPATTKTPATIVDAQVEPPRRGLSQIFARTPKGTEVITQSEIVDQAETKTGDIPIPPVALPDVNRAPRPPAPFASQLSPYAGSAANPYATPALSSVSLKADSPTVNAFTPAPRKDVVAGVGNAFSPAPTSMPKGSPATLPDSSGSQPSEPAMVVESAPEQTQTVPAMLPPALTSQQPANPNMQAGYGPVVNTVQPMSDSTVSQLAVLKDSMYPSQREWAAVSLATVDWHTQPQVLRSLIEACREDPAATVRAACVRTILKMKANTPEVVNALRALKNDGDPRVKLEVEQALPVLTGLPAAGMSRVAMPNLSGNVH
jgi:hypothetical protein